MRSLLVVGRSRWRGRVRRAHCWDPPPKTVTLLVKGIACGDVWGTGQGTGAWLGTKKNEEQRGRRGAAKATQHMTTAPLRD